MEKQQRPSLLTSILSVPLNIFLALAGTLFSALRPYAPRLVPLVVFSSFIPLILLLSASAGWIVWSSLSVSWEVPIYLQYGDGGPPYAYVSLPPLTPQQRYDISVDLVLPYTESNSALGNFMTTLSLSTPNNKSVAYVRRPAIALPPRSHYLLPQKLSQKLHVPLIESFTAGKSNLAAKVQIGRDDGWTTLGQGHGREVSVISAHLRGLVVLHGIRGLAIRFPLLSALASSGIFLLILSTILATCVLPLVLPPPQEEEDEFEGKNELKERDQNISSTSRTPKEGRRRRSRSSKGSDEHRVKAEETVQTIPPLEQDPTRGLRRRSSKPSLEHTDGES